MLNRVNSAVEVIVGIITNADAVTQSSEPIRGSTGSPSAPGAARREPVLGLLEANGGRVWQQDVVTELDSSAPTVSRLLSEMEDDEKITRYWKRGQKVVASPELGPEAVASGSNQKRQR